MTSNSYLKMTTAELLKQRMKEGKKELSAMRAAGKQDFFDYVIETEPAYDSYMGGVKMTNAWNGKTPDLRVTELITQYVEVVKLQLATQSKKAS